MSPNLQSVGQIVLASALTLSSVASRAQVELLLMPLRDSHLDERIIKQVPTSCGPLALARVSSIPFSRDNRLGAPDAYLVGSDGVIQKQWSVPADASPRAATDLSLVVSTHAGLVSVSSDRSVKSTALPPETPLSRPSACPAQLLQRHPTGFVCIAVPLLGSTSSEVLVAHQSPCTPR